MTIFRFENFLSGPECVSWIERAPKYDPDTSYAGDDGWKKRTIDITGDEVVERVKAFLLDRLGADLTCKQAQIQLWFDGSVSDLHIHEDYGRDSEDFNSLIYLNDDFTGGEFFTATESIKPQPGLLTFFDGSKIYHGVRRVSGGHRYTLIFWWNNTRFLR